MLTRTLILDPWAFDWCFFVFLLFLFLFFHPFLNLFVCWTSCFWSGNTAPVKYSSDSSDFLDGSFENPPPVTLSVLSFILELLVTGCIYSCGCAEAIFVFARLMALLQMRQSSLPALPAVFALAMKSERWSHCVRFCSQTTIFKFYRKWYGEKISSQQNW